MGKADKKPQATLTRESLGQFEPISSLSNERLDELVSLSYVESINMGVSLFREGDVDNQTIYILNGDVQLTSSTTEKEILIHSNSKEGKFPLDDSQPRLCSAVAMSSVEIVRIDNSVLDYMMMWDQLAVAEISNNEDSTIDKTEPDKKPEKVVDDNVEMLVKQAVLDSIENAKEPDKNLDSVDKIDFTKTIKPELTTEKISNKESVKNNDKQNKDNAIKTKAIINEEIKNDSDEKWKKKTDLDSNAQTTVNEAIKIKEEPVEEKSKNKENKNKENSQDKPANKSETKATNVQTAAKPVAKEIETKTPVKKVQNIKSEEPEKDKDSIVYESRDWIRKIRQIMAFKNMPPANIKNLLEKMESVNVKQGDKIIEQGGEGDYYYIVTDGTAVVTRTIELATLSAGTSFGEEALVAKSPRNASVSMTSDGILMRLSKKDFDELLIEPLMARVSPDEARSKILQGAKWLDVRHAKEFHHSRLPGAINIPLHELRLRMGELDKETDYICCCRTGARSSSGSFLLAQNGFKVSLLTGGIQVMSQDLRR